jgi:hypothetical protein
MPGEDAEPDLGATFDESASLSAVSPVGKRRREPRARAGGGRRRGRLSREPADPRSRLRRSRIAKMSNRAESLAAVEDEHDDDDDLDLVELSRPSGRASMRWRRRWMRRRTTSRRWRWANDDAEEPAADELAQSRRAAVDRRRSWKSWRSRRGWRRRTPDHGGDAAPSWTTSGAMLNDVVAKVGRAAIGPGGVSVAGGSDAASE